MPKTVAQWTGLAVTTIIVFGCDVDVITAMPLGILASALAALLVSLDDARQRASLLTRASALNRIRAD